MLTQLLSAENANRIWGAKHEIKQPLAGSSDRRNHRCMPVDSAQRTKLCRSDSPRHRRAAAWYANHLRQLGTLQAIHAARDAAALRRRTLLENARRRQAGCGAHSTYAASSNLPG